MAECGHLIEEYPTDFCPYCAAHELAEAVGRLPGNPHSPAMPGAVERLHREVESIFPAEVRLALTPDPKDTP